MWRNVSGGGTDLKGRPPQPAGEKHTQKTKRVEIRESTFQTRGHPFHRTGLVSGVWFGVQVPPSLDRTAGRHVVGHIRRDMALHAGAGRLELEATKSYAQYRTHHNNEIPQRNNM